jgi:hypothetical protein
MFNYNVQVYPFFYLYTAVLHTSYKFTACIIPGGDYYIAYVFNGKVLDT